MVLSPNISGKYGIILYKKKCKTKKNSNLPYLFFLTGYLKHTYFLFGLSKTSCKKNNFLKYVRQSYESGVYICNK